MNNWPYNPNIPNPPNQPSQDVFLMQTNTNSINSILAVDHISFRANNGGTHNQTQFSQFSSGPIPSGTASSVAYPAAGVASTSTAQMYFKNSQATTLMSCVKAFASITVPNTTQNVTVPLPDTSVTNSYNILISGSTINRAVVSAIITINLQPNCVIGTNACVLLTGAAASYTINSNQIVITVNTNPSAVVGARINFAILQA